MLPAALTGCSNDLPLCRNSTPLQDGGMNMEARMTWGRQLTMAFVLACLIVATIYVLR